MGLNITTDERLRLGVLLSSKKHLSCDEIKECDILFGLFDEKNIYMDFHADLFNQNFSIKARNAAYDHIWSSLC